MREGNKGLLCWICIPFWNLWHFTSERELYYLFSIPCLSLPPCPQRGDISLLPAALPSQCRGIVSTRPAAFRAGDETRAVSRWRGVGGLFWLGLPACHKLLVASTRLSFQGWPDQCDTLSHVCSSEQGPCKEYLLWVSTLILTSYKTSEFKFR